MLLNEEIFTIRDIPSKGKGLVAVTKIPKGFCILTEPPLIQVPRESPSHEVLHQIIIDQLVKLSEAQRKSFYSLLNSHPDLGQEVGIAETNGLCPGPDAKNGFIFPITSRINHSCKPNAQTQWNEHLNNIDVYAIEAIEQGQEITITYLGEPLLAYEERQKKLKAAFNFDCYCNLCYLSPTTPDFANLRNTTTFPHFSGLKTIRVGPEGLSSPGHINVNTDEISQGDKYSVFLGEITHVEDSRRMTFTVKDKNGLEIPFVSGAESRRNDIGDYIRPVAFNTRIRDRVIDDSKPRVGYTVMMLEIAHVSTDETIGIIPDDPSQLRVLPTSLEELLCLSDKVQEYSIVHNRTRKCHGCYKESDSLKKCSRCGFFWYCNQDCQARRWNKYEHRNDCELLQNVNIKGLFLVEWEKLQAPVSFPLSV